VIPVQKLSFQSSAYVTIGSIFHDEKLMALEVLVINGEIVPSQGRERAYFDEMGFLSVYAVDDLEEKINAVYIKERKRRFQKYNSCTNSDNDSDRDFDHNALRMWES